MDISIFFIALGMLIGLALSMIKDRIEHVKMLKYMPEARNVLGSVYLVTAQHRTIITLHFDDMSRAEAMAYLEVIKEHIEH